MTKYRIGIDGYNLAMPRGTGVATYAFSLARNVAALGHETTGVFGLDVGKRPETRELMFFDGFGRTPQKETRRQIRNRIIRETRATFFTAQGFDVPMTDAVEKQSYVNSLPGFDRVVSSARLFEVGFRHLELFGSFLKLRVEHPPEIMHWTYPVPVVMEGSRNIYTLHDLVPLRLPYTTLDHKHLYYKLVERAALDSHHICTVSEASRDDILSRFPIAPDKVTNTYQSIPVPAGALSRNPAEDAAMIEGMFGLQQRGYFLFFGALDPKKNIARIIEAYLTSRMDTPLVIVGARNWGTEQESKMLGGGGVSVYGHAVNNRIVQLDYLPRDLLFRLIRGAKAVMFPSLFEGFGLPALEAIQLGTPVISSNISSLPEIVGDAGLLVDPYNVQAIADAMLAIDGDPAVGARLTAASAAQAAKFGDEPYRERLTAMYDHVMATKA
ncbi:glycosyltransferase family 4 protein [Sphingomonas montanisoli]|uniref:Glycosyltransferase family 4 protein n=1 Tax=Sphingomonas montanisoli TaxID=2606412 RepID=A0A5D9C6P0_9SPHN|nr:glycosyltransferase family 1 protein [Sphingomonas montanisoli]TZG27349.1 glycosyltransferase family 4 protein [Sphingomonas montanisoli]